MCRIVYVINIITCASDGPGSSVRRPADIGTPQRVIDCFMVIMIP